MGFTNADIFCSCAFGGDSEAEIIDFTQAFTREEASQYLVDKAHPNKAGMDRLANVAINDLIK